MIDLERELKLLTTETGFRLCAERLQFWQLCARASCRRGRACRDPLRCGARLAAWAEAVKAARLDRGSYDPEADAIRFELAERIRRLAQPAP